MFEQLIFLQLLGSQLFNRVEITRFYPRKFHNNLIIRILRNILIQMIHFDTSLFDSKIFTRPDLPFKGGRDG